MASWHFRCIFLTAPKKWTYNTTRYPEKHAQSNWILEMDHNSEQDPKICFNSPSSWLSIIIIDTSNSQQSVNMTIWGWDYQSWKKMQFSARIFNEGLQALMIDKWDMKLFEHHVHWYQPISELENFTCNVFGTPNNKRTRKVHFCLFYAKPWAV